MTKVIERPFCSKCGQPQKTDNLCARCQVSTETYTRVRSWAVFEGPLQAAIHRLKYRRDLGLGEALARPMIQLYESLKWETDVVLPVPLSGSRRRERGYNQVALLAKPIALSAGLPYRPESLQRVRDTRSQVGLALRERTDNVRNAFRGHQPHINGKSVLVIDDVMTSGATLEACSEALLKCGARKVYALTLARAVSEP